VVALEQVDLRPVPPNAVIEGSDAVSAVLQGLGRDLTVADFGAAARLLGAGVPWVATNDDATLPLPWGQAPGNGAYVRLLAAVVGRDPEVVGKPHRPLYRLAMERLGTTSSRTLAIGDRLDTDIAGAQATGIDSAWVLTGVDRPSGLLAGDTSPTYVLSSLDELLMAYAVPIREGSRWRCGDAVVSLTDGGLTVEQCGTTAIEVVRAGVAALLTERDAGGVPEKLRDAARVLDRALDGVLDGQ